MAAATARMVPAKSDSAALRRSIRAGAVAGCPATCAAPWTCRSLSAEARMASVKASHRGRWESVLRS